MRHLPTGTVTFLFTDIEGSTRLLHELGPERYGAALADHRRLLRTAFAAHGGVEVDTQGDAFFVAFSTASAALSAATDAQRALDGGPVDVRMGVHTGEPLVIEEGYVGGDVHRAARIAAAAHGGQILISQTTRDLVETDARDLGPHRLKDLGEPVRLFQLGDVVFPPPTSLNYTNLPIQPTPFLGRERELAEVVGLVTRRDGRLLTLTGAGGSGKTRLALQAAAEVIERFPDGVWWAPLQGVREPALVAPAVAHAIGATNELAVHVGDREMLVLLDNFEHVAEAAPVLADLLAVCANVHLLVTSREPLRLAAERRYAVQPFVAEEGVGFFRARATAVDPDFAADGEVAEICRRLDNLPLALELAAARVNVLSPGQILARLERRLPLLTGGPRDAPERQRTLRATIEWSHELLDDDERRLFARLSVFAGGCTLEDAEAVCEANLETLASLVDKSLLRASDGRYALLETVREYAAEQLEHTGERDAISARLVERLRESLANEGDEPFLDTDNWRAAVEWAIERGDAEAAFDLARAGRMWRAEWPEVIHWARRAVGRRDDVPPTARGRLFSTLSIACTVSGDFAEGVAAGEEAVALLRGRGSAVDVADALLTLGQAVSGVGDDSRAEELYGECLALAAEAGDERLRIGGLHLLGELERDRGRLGRARELLEEVIELVRESGRQPLAELHGLGDVELEERRVQAAAAAYGEVVSGSVATGAWFTLVNAIAGLAAVAAEEGRVVAAGRLWGAADSLSREHGVRLGPAESARYLRRLDRLDPAALAAHVEQGRELGADAAVAEALAVAGGDG